MLASFLMAIPRRTYSAAAKTFDVPVTINGNLTVTGKCLGCGGASGDETRVADGAGARWSVSLTGQKAAIAATNLCASSACGAGQYRVSYYLDATERLCVRGGAETALTIAWKDETSAKSIRVPLSGAGVSGGNSLSLGATPILVAGISLCGRRETRRLRTRPLIPHARTGAGSYAVRIAVEDPVMRRVFPVQGIIGLIQKFYREDAVQVTL